MPRTHGYSPKGQRGYGTHDWQGHKRMNVIGALREKAMLTVCAFQETINSDIFHAWIVIELKWIHDKALQRKHRCDIDTLFKLLDPVNNSV